MGDFFNEIVIFFEEYYVYAIGVGLIIILMLIGLLASRKKAKKEHKAAEPMANINEVNTGSINDVADTLQSNVMQPVDVVSAPVVSAPAVSETFEAPVTPEVASADVVEPIAPIATPISVETPASDIVTPVSEVATPASDDIFAMASEPVAESSDIVTPIDEVTTPVETPVVTPMEAPIVSEPIVAESIVTEEVTPIATPVTPISTPVAQSTDVETATIEPIVPETVPVVEEQPVEDDRFDKTEIIDFSALEPTNKVEEPAKSADVAPTNFTPFVVDKSQLNDSSDDSILN